MAIAALLTFFVIDLTLFEKQRIDDFVLGLKMFCYYFYA